MVSNLDVRHLHFAWLLLVTKEDQNEQMAPVAEAPPSVSNAILASDLSKGMPTNVVANVLGDGVNA